MKLHICVNLLDVSVDHCDAGLLDAREANARHLRDMHAQLRQLQPLSAPPLVAPGQIQAAMERNADLSTRIVAAVTTGERLRWAGWIAAVASATCNSLRSAQNSPLRNPMHAGSSASATAHLLDLPAFTS